MTTGGHERECQQTQGKGSNAGVKQKLGSFRDRLIAALRKYTNIDPDPKKYK
jgi:hypothetical protein